MSKAIKLSADGSMVSVNRKNFALNPIRVVYESADVETVTEMIPKGRAAKGSVRMHAYLKPTLNNTGKVNVLLTPYACDSSDLRAIDNALLSARGYAEGVRVIPCKDIEEALHMASIFLA